MCVIVIDFAEGPFFMFNTRRQCGSVMLPPLQNQTLASV
jgi:hypothetical protein